MVGIPNGCEWERKRKSESRGGRGGGEEQDRDVCMEWLALPHSPVVFTVKRAVNTFSLLPFSFFHFFIFYFLFLFLLRFTFTDSLQQSMFTHQHCHPICIFKPPNWRAPIFLQFPSHPLSPRHPSPSFSCPFKGSLVK